jgi:hypothetical protein
MPQEGDPSEFGGPPLSEQSVVPTDSSMNNRKGDPQRLLHNPDGGSFQERVRTDVDVRPHTTLWY